MSEFDGQKQRNALTAVEQALRSLGAGQSDRARKNAAKAADLDQIDAYQSFVAAAESAADDIDAAGLVSAATWDAIALALEPGPLRFLVDDIRSTTNAG